MRNGNSNFNLSPDRWQQLNRVAHDESAKIRLRDVFPLWGNSGGYVDSIVGHEVTVALGEPLKIRAGQHLVPVELAAEFQLSPEQFHDEHVAEALTAHASNLIRVAEESVILHGDRARAFLTSINVVERNLDKQRGLFKENQPQVQRPILESILGAKKELEKRHQQGPFVVIVDTELFREAHAPRQNPLDAPKYEIFPLLREGGFRYSPAAPEKTGVMLSLGGRPLDIAVPVDVMVELTDEEKGVAFLRTVEQFALRINDGRAIEALA